MNVIIINEVSIALHYEATIRLSFLRWAGPCESVGALLPVFRILCSKRQC